MQFEWFIHKTAYYSYYADDGCPFSFYVEVNRYSEDGKDEDEEENVFHGNFVLVNNWDEADAYSGDACYAYESSVFDNEIIKKSFTLDGGVENVPALILEHYEFTKAGSQMALNEKVNCITAALARCIPEVFAVKEKGIFFLYLKKEEEDICSSLKNGLNFVYPDEKAKPNTPDYANLFGIAEKSVVKKLLNFDCSNNRK